MTGPIAENRYTLTKALFDEGMKQVWTEANGSFIRKAVCVLVGIWAIMTGITICLKQSPIVALLEALVLLLAGLWVAVLMPRSKTKRAFRQLQNRCGTDMERTILFYEKYLTVNAAGSEVTVAYEDLIRVRSTGHLLILVSADKTGVLVKRDSFLRGSEEAVLAAVRPEPTKE